MPSIVQCCKDCPDRKIVDGIRCHSWCDKYAKEAAANKRQLDEKFNDRFAAEYLKDQRTRVIRRKQNKRRK